MSNTRQKKKNLNVRVSLCNATNKKVDLGRESLSETKEERCATEQYAQHKVQAVRLWRLIQRAVGNDDKTYEERGNHSI